MNMRSDDQFIFARRNFLMAMLIYPFASKLMANKNINRGNLFLNEGDGFIILDGWVLVKDDLIEKLT
jgi:hypothetical protein